MTPGVFSDPVAGPLLGSLLVCWAALEVRTARRHPAAHTAADRGTRRLVVAGYLGGILAAILAAMFMPVFVLPARTAYEGSALLAAGLALRVWSITTLGRWFTYDVYVEPGQRLIQSGPYRFVRHPSYSGALLAALGLGVALGSVASAVVAVAIPFAAVAARVRTEDAVLVEAFGDEFRVYAARTRPLVPGRIT